MREIVQITERERESQRARDRERERERESQTERGRGREIAAVCGLLSADRLPKLAFGI